MKLYKLYLTNNACYKAGQKIKPKGAMLHSTGANNPNLRRYVGPDDGRLGHNANGNHWNQNKPDGRSVCAHGFIGKLADGTIASYNTLPWDINGWHAGGSANNTYIGIEICEDGLNDAAYFNAVYTEAVELFAYLCELYNFTEKDIICHSEGYKLGIASNHGDVMHWFPKHGKSMDTFRADVKKLLNKTEAAPAPAPAGTLYRVQVGAYKDRGNADRQQEKVKTAGFETYMVKVDDLYKIQVGAFSVKYNAEQLLDKIKAAGFEAFVTTKGGTPAGPATAPAKQIKKGDTVRLKAGAKDYNGGSLASFIFKRDHKVSELKGDRAVITYGGEVVAAVKVSDLVLS